MAQERTVKKDGDGKLMDFNLNSFYWTLWVIKSLKSIGVGAWSRWSVRGGVLAAVAVMKVWFGTLTSLVSLVHLHRVSKENDWWNYAYLNLSTWRSDSTEIQLGLVCWQSSSNHFRARILAGRGCDWVALRFDLLKATCDFGFVASQADHAF